MAQKPKFRIINGGKSKKVVNKKTSRKEAVSTKRQDSTPRWRDSDGADRMQTIVEAREKARRRWLIVLAVLVVLAAGCLAALLYIKDKYEIQTIIVEGNVHYTNEEIADMVLTSPLAENSLYLSMKYKDREIKGIPFIQTMSVTVLSPDTVRLDVYEKSVAGYVEYAGRYMYFDKDGIVVESSESRTPGIPQVTGFSFDHMVLYEKIPIDNNEIFQKILNITHMLAKYEITTNKIYFDENEKITLYFDKVRVRVGTDNLEEKIMRLQFILPSLDGKSGVLDMENYTDESENITFRES